MWQGWLLRLFPYTATLVAVGAVVLVVGVLESSIVDPPAAILLYLVPVVLAASQWGRGPALAAVAVSLLLHDLLFVDPRGTFSITRTDETLGLVLLLFTALVTAQLADRARRSASVIREATVVRRSDELKTALLRAVTHDLRTPLASIKASISGLRQPGADYSAEDRGELMANVESETDRLTRLVDNLLDASRLAAGRVVLNAQPQDLGEIVAVALDGMKLELNGRSVSVEIPPDLVPVACDYVQIEQVLTNLLENAARHTQSGASIRIRAASKNTMVEVEVSDDGPGVPWRDRERIFNAFERGASRANGTGLGLAIARGFVEAHGGRLWLVGDTRQGASFIFTVPSWLSP